jgi:hypothetical protein
MKLAEEVQQNARMTKDEYIGRINDVFIHERSLFVVMNHFNEGSVLDLVCQI